MTSENGITTPYCDLAGEIAVGLPRKSLDGVEPPPLL